MEYSSLYDMITFLQYGTNLHIGVLFFGDYGNEKVILPQKQQIHAGAICNEFKTQERGFRRCFRCRQIAIEKAIRTKTDFGGLCINGVYEYTRPVVIKDECACIIYIGNILENGAGYEKIKKNICKKKYLLDTMEKDFNIEKCKAMGALIETYIRILLENFPSGSRSKFNPLIENIKNYIESNLEFDIKLSQIADIFHYNEQYIGRIFKKETKMSFSEYLNRQRIKCAGEFLTESDGTVIDIANKVGFNNVTYFNRLFKKYYGFTPSQYRKNTAKSQQEQ